MRSTRSCSTSSATREPGAIASQLTRQQILAFRRRVGGLDERCRRPPSRCGGRRGPACRTACREPRCSHFTRGSRGSSLRVGGSLARPALGPSLQRLCRPEARLRAVLAGEVSRRRQGPPARRADGRAVARRLHGGRMTDREVGRALGIGNAMRYAATRARSPSAGRARGLRRLDGSRSRRSTRPTRVANSPGATFTSSGRPRPWVRPLGGDLPAVGGRAFASLEESLLPVRSPLGDEWLLAEDEPAIRAAESAAAPARLLPSGDAYFLLDRKERELLVPRGDRGRCSGRPACGRAPSSSRARSAEPGDGRSTRDDRGLGRLSRGGAKRSRPRLPPCPCRASTARSRWSGTLSGPDFLL